MSLYDSVRRRGIYNEKSLKIPLPSFLLTGEGIPLRIDYLLEFIVEIREFLKSFLLILYFS